MFADMERALIWCCCMLAILGAQISVSGAQDSACLNQLVPCLQYINSKQTPSSSCCSPLKSLITSDPQCLCSMLTSNSATQQAGVNVTQALLLPARCGERVNAGLCTSSQKKRNAVSSSAGELIFANAAMVAVLLFIVQSLWLLHE
uniref:Bifunctional inhibitor/plant lipid transfer protein/seed storage helical domain-containing protein n=1 Tax=Ananas comosus var. bracteatus TaxID=296719 RepID=A0A6V7QN16_ANACO|nr:unnamed protein product [Ananas comosus var. bracteatus]